MKSLRPVCLSVCLVVLGGLASAQQASPQKVSLNIPAQPIGDALNELAHQAGLQVVFYTSISKGLTGPALTGDFTPKEAVEKLLAGTPLSYQFINAHTMTIRTAEPGAAQQKSKSALRLAQAETATTSEIAATSVAGTAAGETTTVGETVMIEEIVVTAQKRRENLKEVPIAISVVSSEHLEQFHATQLSDFVNYIPGIQASKLGSVGQNIITLRGISPLGSNQTVGVYIDDAPLGSSGYFAAESTQTADLLPYDIERIEVLRGAQGTLYGGSGNAGLLKYVTRAPNLSDFELRAGTEVYDMAAADEVGWGGRLGINAPLIEGKVAVRASYAYLHTPGYVDNILSGIEDQNEAAQQSGRVALLWQATDEISLKLVAMWQAIDSDNNGFSLLNRPSRTLFSDTHTYSNRVREPFERDLNYYTATLDWALGWADFVSATSFSDTRSRGVTDVSDQGALFPFFGAPVGLSEFIVMLDLDKWTQEFRLSSPSGGRVEWLLGAFYTDEESANRQVSTALTLAGEPIPAINPFSVAGLPSQYREYAAFGNLTYRFGERFDVTGGLRWARNEQDFRQITGGPFFELIGFAGDFPGHSSESVVTYSLAPRLRLSRDTMIYARVATGYRPGGPNVALPGVKPIVDSDLLTNYEVGVKTELLERRVAVDGAVFRMDWKDIQLTIPAVSDPRFAVADNAAAAWSQGAEVATIFRPAAGLQLGLNGAYVETKITELGQSAATFPAQPGDSLQLVPEWSASATADYAFSLGARRARVGAGYRYVDARRNGFPASPLSVVMDSYEALDLNAEVAAENWTLRLFATNVTDEEGQQITAFQGDPALATRFLSTLLRPRVVGLSLDLRF